MAKEKIDINRYIEEITFDEPIKYYPKSILLAKQKLIDSYNNFIDEINIKIKNNELVEYTDEDLKKVQIQLNIGIEELNKQYISLYPLNLKQYFKFMVNSQCLQMDLDKRRSKDVEILKMSYLDYLFYLINEKNRLDINIQLIQILQLCLQIDSKDIDCPLYSENKGKMNLLIKGIEINKKDFDTIRKLILYQNVLDFDDEYINPDIADAMKEVDNLHSKEAGNPTLEKLIVSIIAATGLDEDAIKKLSMRKFNLLLKQISARETYQICMQGQASGMVTYKEELQHWIYGKEKGKYDGKFVELNKITSTINSANGK